MKVMMDKQAAGGGVLHKLILGFSMFNILVTASVLLYPSSASVSSVGPSCHEFIKNADLLQAALFIREESSNDCFAGKESAPSIQGLRQLTTGLDRQSAYTINRAHLFEDPLMQPATIFSLCKYPTNGFGLSARNKKGRALSLFFLVCANAMLFTDGVLSDSDLEALKKNDAEPSNVNETLNNLEV